MFIPWTCCPFFPFPQAWHLCICSTSPLECSSPSLPVIEHLLSPLYLSPCASFTSILEMSSTKSVSASSSFCARWTHKTVSELQAHRLQLKWSSFELACTVVPIGVGHHYFNESANESTAVPLYPYTHIRGKSMPDPPFSPPSSTFYLPSTTRRARSWPTHC